eukprot:UN03956
MTRIMYVRQCECNNISIPLLSPTSKNTQCLHTQNNLFPPPNLSNNNPPFTLTNKPAYH